MGTFTVDDARPTLAVADVGRSIEWYTRVLGVTCDITMGDPPTFALLDRPDAHLLALAWAADPHPAEFAAVYVNVRGVDAAHEHCVAQGVEVVEPLTTHPWGQRDFVVLDPDGHRLALGEHVGAAAH